GQLSAMSIASNNSDRTSLAIGWEAAKANAVPAFILQGAMLAVLVSYYWSPACADFLNRLAHYKEQHGLLFIVLAAAVAGAILPELFVIVFFQRCRPRAQNLHNLAYTIPTWAIDGILVDLMYRLNALWFGNVVTIPVVMAKILVDQLGYNPFFAAPAEVLVYEWKNEGFSWKSVRRALTWEHYRDKIVPTLLATWAVWGPLMAIIYSLPYPLQFPLFSIALTFWVLLLTYMTNRFAGKIEADALPALSVAKL
ncbi:MAG: hypothetical protein M3N12_06680, partial [Verrucomicrobiota bacterium]|nr:hypothetical protein [Verrucomicrobiota bacterium]